MILLLLALALPAQDADPCRAWVAQLSSLYEEDRLAAEKKLEEAGKEAETALGEGLSTDDHHVRRVCLGLLMKLGSPKALDEAAKLFRNRDEERTVRQTAFDYLRSLPKEAEAALIEALDSSEEAWRLGAVMALRESGSAACAEKIAALYDREQARPVKDAAFECLQSIGKPAQPYLLKLLSSADAAVRLGALRGLKNIGAAGAEILDPVGTAFRKETSADVLAEAYLVLAAAGPGAEPHFLAGLKSESEAVRLKSVEGLRQLLTPGSMAAVGERFEGDPSEAVRSAARECLERHGLKAEEILVRAIGNANAKVRAAALRTLAELRSDKAFETVAALYPKETDAEVRAQAFAFLERMPVRAEKLLLVAMKEAAPDLRRRAILALGEARSDAAIEPLIDLLSDLNLPLRDAAVDALVRIGPKAVDAVREASAADRVRKAQVEQITALFHQEEVERRLDRLISGEGGSGVFPGQFDALKELGREKALPTLLRIATSPSYTPRIRSEKGPADLYQRNLRDLAILALGEIGDKETAKSLAGLHREKVIRFGEDGHECLVVALHKLGETWAYDEFQKRVMQEVEKLAGDPAGTAVQLILLARTQGRVGLRAEAEKTYLDLLKRYEGERPAAFAEVLYNLACLAAGSGEKAKAVDYLGRAVDAGFKDREWIGMDRDLDPIRDEAAYKALMADAKRFEKPLD